MVRMLSYFLFPASMTALAMFMILTIGCAAAPQLATFDQKLYMEADSLFKIGDYKTAGDRYNKIRSDFPQSRYAAKAQYSMGYLWLHYDNPAASWDNALREFKTFTTTYPGSDLMPEVNSWIRLLVVLQTFKREYNLTSTEIATLQNKLLLNASARQTVSQNTEYLMESIAKCGTDKDSLNRKIKVLEEVIDIFEKRR